MLPSDPSLEMGLPEFPSGSVWLVGAGAGNPRQFSALALHALGTADAVIHDPGVAREILELVRPPCYREAALPTEAIQRSVKLAQDGWRIVRLVEGNPLERRDTNECAANFAKHDIPFHIIPTGEPFIGQAPIGLLLVCNPRLARRTNPQFSEAEAGMVVVSIISPGSEERLRDGSTRSAQRWQAPLGFSMTGLAG
jgi:uroporphyrin-III C-methyltransferase